MSLFASCASAKEVVLWVFACVFSNTIISQVGPCIFIRSCLIENISYQQTYIVNVNIWRIGARQDAVGNRIFCGSHVNVEVGAGGNVRVCIHRMD